jgi:hypothetical protein
MAQNVSYTPRIYHYNTENEIFQNYNPNDLRSVLNEIRRLEGLQSEYDDNEDNLSQDEQEEAYANWGEVQYNLDTIKGQLIITEEIRRCRREHPTIPRNARAEVEDAIVEVVNDNVEDSVENIRELVRDKIRAVLLPYQMNTMTMDNRAEGGPTGTGFHFLERKGPKIFVGKYTTSLKH